MQNNILFNFLIFLMEQNIKKLTKIIGFDKLDTHPSLIFIER
jgi:hypothetical protein